MLFVAGRTTTSGRVRGMFKSRSGFPFGRGKIFGTRISEHRPYSPIRHEPIVFAEQYAATPASLETLSLKRRIK